jgi:hypothetical protein
MYRPFTVTWEEVLPGDPAQAWEAITARCSAWIWEIDYEPRRGGAERGLTGSGGTVTAWDPPHHFQTRAERPDGWHNELDYRLEPHADGTLVRFVHRSVTGADRYDVVYDECVQHTSFYRHSLGEYVRHFAGREATYVGVDGDGAFADVCARLGLPREAAVGDAVRLEPDGLPAIEGTIDYLTPTFLGVRGDHVLLRVYGRDVWNDPTTIALHLFDQDVDVAQAERACQHWMTQTEAVA